MQFSEFINADKLLQNLIITPQTEVKYNHLVKRNQLTIKFEEPFEPNTTYSLNFFDAITDITEKNPAVNLLLAFSTGDFIDSMQVNGKVTDLLSQEASSAFTIGLYPPSDSLDYFTQSPIYFTTSNDSGEFVIPYIKTGKYKILAFNDDNRNLTLDPETEDHGFLSDTLHLLSDTAQVSLFTLLQNVKPIQRVNNRPIGPYHEVRYNKQISSYSTIPDSSITNLVGDNKDIIRIYNVGQYDFNDSIPIIIQAFDSIGNTSIDSLKAVFLESNRKPSPLTAGINSISNSRKDLDQYIVNFNKPMIEEPSLHATYLADTLFSYDPDSITVDWNANKSEAIITSYLQTDSLFAAYDRTFEPDTAALSSLRPVRPPKLNFTLSKGSFVSIENDSSSVLKAEIKRKSIPAIGTLKLRLTTSATSFDVQLLNNKKDVAYSIKNEANPTFNVKPGTYSVRILIDTNADGTWSFGNLLTNEEPENVYLFPEEIAVRENWIVEDIHISF